MTTHLVHDEHHALVATLGREGRQALVQTPEHHVIKALVAVAESGLRGRIQILESRRMWDAITDALAAAGLVVEPKYGEARSLQHIQQVFVIVLARLEILLAQRREHAG